MSEIWSNFGAAQGWLGTRKRNRSNDLDLICVTLEGRRSIQLSYRRTSCIDFLNDLSDGTIPFWRPLASAEGADAQLN